MTVGDLKALVAGNRTAEYAMPERFALNAYDDQVETIRAAIAKAKEINGIEVNSVAFECICLEFLRTSGSKKSARSTGASTAATPDDGAFAARFRELGVAETLELVAGLNDKADPRTMVVDFLRERGVGDTVEMLEMAFSAEEMRDAFAGSAE